MKKSEIIRSAKEWLKRQTTVYQCEVDGPEDPDATCVFQGEQPISDCFYAQKLQREGKGMCDCQYWCPTEKTKKSSETAKIVEGLLEVIEDLEYSA